MAIIQTQFIPILDVQISPEDEEFISLWTWMPQYVPSERHYAIRENDGVRMHVLIVEHQYNRAIPKGFVVDHIDGNGLNNQRENLRVVTRSENGTNRRKQKGTSSIYKGVYYHIRDNLYHASIRVDGKRHFLGAFHSESEAARAYDSAAKATWGDIARLNFSNTD